MIKTLELDLSPGLSPGWYRDQETGEWYYYDADGRRYIYIAGQIYPAMLWETAPKVVNLKTGDTLRIAVSFKYSGPQKSLVLRGCVGNLGSVWPYTFDEVLWVRSPSFTIGPDNSPKIYTKQVDVPITTVLAAGKSYSIYTKLEDGIGFTEGQTGSKALKDAVFIVSAEPVFSEFSITNYEQVPG